MDDSVNDNNVQALLSSVAGALCALDSRGIPVEQVMRILAARGPAGVPVSIFNSRLGALESIVKYMREELVLDYATIGRLLGRSEGVVGVTYRRALRKMPGRLVVLGCECVPFDVICGKLSVLESISHHLLTQGYTWHEIAAIMHRNDKTIWTVLDRAKRKLAR